MDIDPSKLARWHKASEDPCESQVFLLALRVSSRVTAILNIAPGDRRRHPRKSDPVGPTPTPQWGPLLARYDITCALVESQSEARQARGGPHLSPSGLPEALGNATRISLQRAWSEITNVLANPKGKCWALESEFLEARAIFTQNF